jgi:hypothetical protein
MTKIAGKTALITGGASGIGLLTGFMLLRKGLAHLIVWDIHPGQAEDRLKQLGRFEGRITTETIDISQKEKLELLAAGYLSKGICPDILVNNAGMIVGKPFIAHTVSDIENTMMVNTTAHLLLTRFFLPGMLKKTELHIVNIASAAAYVGNPGMSVYVGSKWAMTGWSDSLRLELEAINPDFRVTTVNPYYVDTGMFAGVKPGFLLPILKPDKVAIRIVKAITNNRLVVRMPWLISLTPALRGLLPLRLFDFLAGRLLGVYHTMRTFEGKKQ